ncbi:MAG TPA: D-alanyl-D-alanine carboxypeptidase/D-alanyl-D-alanine-endopeptidase [Kofleriaceae bacterium]
MKQLLYAALVVALCGTAAAKPPPKKHNKQRLKVSEAARDPKKLGASARVSFAHDGKLQLARDLDLVAKYPKLRAEPLTAEEETATNIQKLLRSPLLRRGVTAIHVADARTGTPLFSVNAEEELNPASNVKLISTATALELLGPDFRYPTRILGPEPVGGVVKGDIYLLGSYDPTLSISDFENIAMTMQMRGITSIEGSIVVGADPTRDGVYRAIIPVGITAGEPGAPPTVTLPPNFDLVQVTVTATTHKKSIRNRLSYKADVIKTETGLPRITLTIGGTIGKDRHVEYPLWTRQRTATAAYSLIAALRARAINITGEMKVMELGDYVGESVGNGALPVELGRHESEPASEIAARVNKWSVNWLADRLVMTAAGLSRRAPPSMALALDAMYMWLERSAKLPKDKLVIDTGSGLSYRTQIRSQDMVSIVRSAGGFGTDAPPDVAKAWLHSLAIAGTDGTLQHRFRSPDVRGRIVGKTGTLRNVIALAGILDFDPARPLAFSIVTNTNQPLQKRQTRQAHAQVIAEVCRYLQRTSIVVPVTPPPIATPSATPSPVSEGEEIDESGESSPESDPEKALDTETANQQ